MTTYSGTAGLGSNRHVDPGTISGCEMRASWLPAFYNMALKSPGSYVRFTGVTDSHGGSIANTVLEIAVPGATSSDFNNGTAWVTWPRWADAGTPWWWDSFDSFYEERRKATVLFRAGNDVLIESDDFNLYATCFLLCERLQDWSGGWDVFGPGNVYGLDWYP